MKEKSLKFQQIVKTAKKLFWKYGIKRVSIEEICQEAGVSKMTFYKHFTNKIDLARYILEKLFIDGTKQYRQFMDSDIPFEKKIEETIKLKLNNTNEISNEFLNDLYKNDIKELQDFMQKNINNGIQMIFTDYSKAQKKGFIRQDLSIDFLMFMLNYMVEMCTNEKITSMFKNPQEMIKEFTNFFFYGILPRTK